MLSTRLRAALTSPFMQRSPSTAGVASRQAPLVLRGVSHRETIRSRAAKVIAITAVYFDTQGK